MIYYAAADKLSIENAFNIVYIRCDSSKLFNMVITNDMACYSQLWNQQSIAYIMLCTVLQACENINSGQGGMICVLNRKFVLLNLVNFYLLVFQAIYITDLDTFFVNN